MRQGASSGTLLLEGPLLTCTQGDEGATPHGTLACVVDQRL